MNTTENFIATASTTATAIESVSDIVKPLKFPNQPQEWKIVSLRECPSPEQMQHCEAPEQAAAYWRTQFVSIPTSIRNVNVWWF